MISIHSKTLQDLEFQTILETISEYCITEIGVQKVLHIIPYKNQEELMEVLFQTSEYRSSFDNNNALPSHNFEPITNELKFLAIEDSFLEALSFKKIHSLAENTNVLLNFLKKFNDYYPYLHKKASEITITKEITKAIEAIFDKYAEIKDDATPTLLEIRRNMNLVRGKVNQSFGMALSQYNSLGYLDEIRETVVENRRVLAVQAMYRRKVKGSILGSSKTGSIAYIEPESTLRYSRELSNLEYEEQEEIIKILKQLTNNIRPFHELLSQYQDFLSAIDVISAKAKYALKINGLLPKINDEKRVYLREAFHPILFLNNKEKGKTTYPQTFEFDESKRIVVISGPNAGGKTISMKTVGLLQLMLQSGMLIPVHERSETCLFDRILTDIGDNQSIENHLSTYSYRLKNMNYFLKKCNSKTLFLIDEFGTGSDPELGGALAEVFLEEFYHREAFGIITTHYANLKMLANELPSATNANMLFDEKSLEPMYKLIIGQAGSSFTFEVAQKNGIPFGLINRAKKKVEGSKVRFDKTISSLQKERSKLEKTSQNLKEEETKAREESKKMETINAKIQDKLERYQELYDANQRLIYMGQKVDDISGKYFNDKNKKDLIGEFLKMVEIENSKRKKITLKEKKVKEKIEKEVLEEVQIKVEEIRKEKKEKKEIAKKIEENKPKIPLKVGDRVRMIDGKSIGTIDKIEKNNAIVNYGIFTSKVSLEQLEYIQPK
ncbi:DNA mismatch repair protein MutS [Flavobacterium columnare NBRC 100251 = ATCC 23463]|uniref:MutS family protein n=2 Tax=Flavobacterium columnare TaxID=996 RepID=G8XA21_FLACA|nr:DNA mismatch repair protein MutS [Flavobacterium columnare]AEW85185.1 MutS family protein [Flavobacterium columnare ATCC 49512]AMO19558.1 DNA mismatch repair protein MutS [Flavobacterium columnare]MBF6653472.1 DNA mismatch repair protein MutS [Flavobacterium columnare]MBF6656087.1 DNA mismatch repair protein MutS [Flavobacterium columnare]MBF6658859.1 DNA mismatch repair protein MutS [Flavobacterium columnare]